MKRIVLDASAVMTFFENRPGAQKVEELLQLAMDGRRELFMSVVNWGEVYHSVWRSKGPGVALKTIAEIAQLPIELVDADYDFTKRAAELRAQHKLPYVDCFAAALALNRRAALSTSDSDFAQVEKQVTILWATAP
ncbi:MAG TPA: type II toxin-antitoxin system VapC family toxin [Candidatus Dormibacteraeota bacterium]|nr:type II toxin-antitoxin system VapC family toxin [Candidatus Dormibacteraeota bacterium]